MASLDSLKQQLRHKATEWTSLSKRPLSETEYSAGFDILVRDWGSLTYENFIFPQLSQLLEPLLNLRDDISVLEIGPGPKSVLEHLPNSLRRKIKRYAAFEPNEQFAAKLEGSLQSPFGALPGLETPPTVRQVPFTLSTWDRGAFIAGSSDIDEKFDIILFCHSMYGMKPRREYIKKALGMLIEQPDDGMVVVFHRHGTWDLNGLVCQKTATFSDGLIRVEDTDKALDCFASYIAGYAINNENAAGAIGVEWRKLCRALGRREGASHLLFSSPEVMVTFSLHSMALSELVSQLPSVVGNRPVKNREALVNQPAAVVRPTSIGHVQQCVRWALKHKFGLTVIGGGHSGHCLWPGVVAIDMAAFDQMHIHATEETAEKPHPEPDCFLVAETGCNADAIVREAAAAGLTVPLGARPSVGAGLWLQGGVGHLARSHGLTCDAIVGAVMISVDSCQILCVGHVPPEHQPAGAVRPGNEADLLWALKGAGTNLGIVISVTFTASTDPTYLVRSWVVPMSDSLEAQTKIRDIDQISRKLGSTCSADMYLYWDKDQLHVGVTMFESHVAGFHTISETKQALAEDILGTTGSSMLVDSIGLFDTEIYMTGMHGGHGGGKTSAFKRCLFLRGVGEAQITKRLVAALENRPTPLCYLHLLQGGCAVSDVADNASAFGCRDWDFACVITGVWPREEDASETTFAAVQWVYGVAADLLPLSCGAYGADLGPDPRDAIFAERAFGPNRPRLAGIKRRMDPHNVLAYACPLPKLPKRQRLILLLTGDNCAGKDYCANVWASVFKDWVQQYLLVRVISISDAFKQRYAAATGADLSRLLDDRAYKEEHRPAMTTFFQDQVRERPSLPADHFLDVVYSASDAEVLLITGMRDENPVAAFSHLVPDSRMLEIRIEADDETRRVRRSPQAGDGGEFTETVQLKDGMSDAQKAKTRQNSPDFIFSNNRAGDEAARDFAERNLLAFFRKDLERLSSIVRSVPDFPRRDIEFRHVLNISQQPGGLDLCSTLLQTRFGGEWASIDAVVSCEAGGFIFASALAARVNVPLVLIREAGKLPPPTFSVSKPASHISSSASSTPTEARIEMERDVLRKGASVVVVDDVLATGRTLFAVLQLLSEAGVDVGLVRVIVVAEFPIHRGRELLRKRGFGGTNVKSLLVFDGA